MSRLILLITVTTLAVLNLNGCVPITAVSTAVVGTAINEERSAGDKLDDSLITLKIKDQFAQTEVSEMFSRISVNVMEGRTMLTGSVEDEKYIKEAETLSWKIRGVVEVINEIHVDKKGMADRAKDLMIESAIESKLLFEKELSSTNYVVDVNNGVAYLLGLAQNQEELGKALQIARSVKGVKKVVNHVILKDDLRRKKEVRIKP
jgi:osmotically-inducible protein OsmY